MTLARLEDELQSQSEIVSWSCSVLAEQLVVEGLLVVAVVVVNWSGVVTER